MPNDDLLTELEPGPALTIEQARPLHRGLTNDAAQMEAAIRRAQTWLRGARETTRGLEAMFPALASRDQDIVVPADANRDNVDSPMSNSKPDESARHERAVDRPLGEQHAAVSAPQETAEPTASTHADANGAAAESLGGRQAVLRVLEDAGGEWMKVRAVTKRMIERGWAPDSDDPNGSVRTTLWRIANEQDSPVERHHLDGRTLVYRRRSENGGAP